MKIKGLTTEQAEQKQQKFGKNLIESNNNTNILKILTQQFQSPLIYILFFASLLSAYLDEVRDAFFILIVILINTSLGFYQEYKAEKTLSSLQSRISKLSKIIRNGEKIDIETENIVPEDIIVLEQGMLIPADAEIIESNEIQVDESLLTGESKPVLKQKDNEIFKGTKVIGGLGLAKVKSIGMETEYGRIAKSLNKNQKIDTPTQVRLKMISRFITVLVLFIFTIVVMLGLIRGLPADEIILTSVALAVSTIPEGLLISYTVVLALGMNRIMKQNAIVKNLQSAETLGEVDVLCIDKTGTLTEGKMKITNFEAEDENKFFTALAVCNNDSNFVDEATKNFVIENKSEDFFNKIQNSRGKLFPFSSTEKYTAAVYKNELFVVGSPEVVLKKSNLKDKSDSQDIINEKSKEGVRVLAFAYKDINTEITANDSKKNLTRQDINNLIFGGLLFINDPIRDSVKSSLGKVESAGIKVKVITGDMRTTAVAILNKLDVKLKSGEMIAGKELKLIKNEKEFDEIVLMTRLFYRTTPDQKLSIVKSLQRQNLVVGMMGDGVNDSPAIFNAEIGIGVDSATDVSKEAADIILLDSNFNTIVGAVQEGRSIQKNMKKILTYLFVGSFTEVNVILLSLIFDLPIALIPLQLLWINLIEDGLPSISLAFDKAKKFENKIEAKSNQILKFKNFGLIFLLSLSTDILLFLIYYFIIGRTGDVELARTILFSTISISSLMFLYSAKTINSNIWKERFWDNKIVNLSFLYGVIMIIAARTVPQLQDLLSITSLTALQWLAVVNFSIAIIVILETFKWAMHRFGLRI